MDAFLFRVKAKRVWRNRQRTPNLQSPPSKTHTVINEDGLILYYSSKKKKKNEREISFCAFLSALAVSCVFCVCVVWRSGYNLFCKEQRGSMEGVPKRGYVSEWAQRWRDLTADERNRFSLRCATVCTLTLSTRTLLVNLDPRSILCTILQMKRDYALKMKEYRLVSHSWALKFMGKWPWKKK